MILPIRLYGDPVLRTKPKVVSEIANLEGVVEQMFAVMYHLEGVGLASNQVGIDKRMFVYEFGGMRGVVVNPILEITNDTPVVLPEGCLSVPMRGWQVPRAYAVHLTGTDEHGEPVSIHAEGMLARIFQHEVDHLEGGLLIDRLPEGERRHAKVALRGKNLPE